MKKSILILPILMFGCASVAETHAPDGRKAYTLNCSGMARGWDKCLSASGNICGDAGYDILDKSSEDAAAIGGNTNSFAGGKTNERSMLIACKKPR
jgi:hypothetical protein